MRLYLIAGAAALISVQGFALWVMANRIDMAHKERDKAVAESQAKDAEIVRLGKTEKVVVKYVDRIKTVTRNVPVVRDRLISVCEFIPRSHVSENAGTIDEGTPADPVDRRTDLSAELIACRLNTEQLRGLIAAVRVNQ